MRQVAGKTRVSSVPAGSSTVPASLEMPLNNLLYQGRRTAERGSMPEALFRVMSGDVWPGKENGPRGAAQRNREGRRMKEAMGARDVHVARWGSEISGENLFRPSPFVLAGCVSGTAESRLAEIPRFCGQALHPSRQVLQAMNCYVDHGFLAFQSSVSDPGG